MNLLELLLLKLMVCDGAASEAGAFAVSAAAGVTGEARVVSAGTGAAAEAGTVCGTIAAATGPIGASFCC